MPGMLQEGAGQPPPQQPVGQPPPQQPMGQAAPQLPSSGPIAQTPPSPAPQGNSGGAPGPEHPEQDFVKLRDQAIKLVYGDRFDQLIKMFETNGPEKFARSMAVAVNTPITEIEKAGKLEPEMAAKVGMAIFVRLLEDIVGEGVVPGVTPEQISESFPAIMLMYSDSHPEVPKEDIQAVVKEVQQGMQGDPGAATTDTDIEGILPGVV